MRIKNILSILTVFFLFAGISFSVSAVTYTYYDPIKEPTFRVPNFDVNYKHSNNYHYYVVELKNTNYREGYTDGYYDATYDRDPEKTRTDINRYASNDPPRKTKYVTYTQKRTYVRPNRIEQPALNIIKPYDSESRYKYSSNYKPIPGSRYQASRYRQTYRI
ncbi:MAG: hypothetical protein ABII01_00855 [Candidatus Woesearchaeota archaeon]